MMMVFEPDRGLCKSGDIVLPADAAHKVMEPGPHREMIKLTQQGRMMEADPATPALLYVSLERGFCGGFPAIGNKVELDDQPVVAEELVVDAIGVREIVDGEVAVD